MPWGDGGLSAPAPGGGQSGGFGSGGLANPSHAPTAKPSHGGGFLHSVFHNPVTHVVGKTATDLKNVAVNAPAGFAKIGEATYNQVVHGEGSPWHHQGDKKQPLLDLTVQSGKQIKTDLQHPLRHPGYTLLDVLPAANAAGKAAEVGSLAREGRLGEAGRALVEKRVPPPRVTTAKGVTARLGNYSQSPAVRVAQRYIDQLRERFPDQRIGVLSHTQRVGRALEKQRATEFKIANAPATGLRVAGKAVKHDSPEGLALRSVAEGTPLELMQKTWLNDLTDQTSKGFARNATAVRNLSRQIANAEKAKKFVAVDEHGVPHITDPKLAALYEKTKAVALATDAKIAGTPGLLPEEKLAASINKPGQQYRGGDESFQGGQFHVGYERRNKAFSATRQGGVGSANTVGIPKKPGRFKASTFTNLHEGAFRNDVPSLVADNAVETERYAALLRARQFFVDHAQDSPVGLRNPVAVRTDEIGRQPFDRVVKDFQDQQRQVRQAADHSFNPLGVGYDKTREAIFPQIDPGDFVDHPEVKWIDEPLLGGLNKPGPLATATQYKSVRGALRTVDAINNAQKFAILYLKPAYAVPNIVGNAFLNIVQQGWAAPANLTRSARLAARIGPEDAAVIRDLMGEGIGSSLESRAGLTSKLNNAVARHVFEPIVDTPFRLASFLYEARRELGLHGTMNSADWQRVHGLLHDETLRPQLHDVVLRANKAIIDYGDLTPVEQAFIRRIVFFYPWIKGSTRYAGHFLAEHPNQAGLIGQGGQVGGQEIQSSLGALPSWAEGFFKVGGSQDRPLIVNPTSAGILSQPGQLAETINQFLSSQNPQAAYTLANSLTPALAAALATLSGKDAFTNRNVPRNASTFLHQLNGGIPAETLYQRLAHDQTGRTFPVTHTQALLQFLLGGVAPKTADRSKLNSSAAAEKKPVRP